ncbi:MAG: hypothetical protein U0524_03675 [Candidatus Saccharimonadales bacterium]
MSERNVLLMASDKTGVVELAGAIHEADMNVVATRKTAAHLEEHSDVPLVHAHDFLLDPKRTLQPFEEHVLHNLLWEAEEPNARPELEDEKKNDRLHSYTGHLLARSLSEHPIDLQNDNLPVLHAAYVNLSPPEAIESQRGSHHYLAPDLIGAHVIYGAIDGHRFIGTQSQRISEYIDMLKADPQIFDQEEVKQQSINEALRGLSVFNQRALAQQHYIPTPNFPSEKPPTS